MLVVVVVVCVGVGVGVGGVVCVGVLLVVLFVVDWWVCIASCLVLVVYYLLRFVYVINMYLVTNSYKQLPMEFVKEHFVVS